MLRTLLWAGAFDVLHRFVTCNMIELRQMVRRHLQPLGLARGSPVLDFGCGTGLYAGLFLDQGMQYRGYDIDEKFVAYARLLHPRGSFCADWADVAGAGPYALVVANCCFHHIGDSEAARALADIRSVLAPDGVLLFIDHLPPIDREVPSVRRAYRRLERGEHIRSAAGYERLIGSQLPIQTSTIERSYVWSLASRFNPLFNELVVLRCGVETAERIP